MDNSDGFVGGGGGARDGGGGGGDDDRTEILSVLTDRDDLERIDVLFGGTGGGVFDRTDVFPDLIEAGDAGRVGIGSFVDKGRDGGGDFERTDALSMTGVGGSDVLGAGNRGKGKSAAVGEAALVVGKPAA